MNLIPILVAGLLAAALTGCVSSSSVESRTPSAGSSSAPPDARRRSEVHTALAAEYYARGNFAIALQEAKLAIRDDQTFVGAWNMQGLVFMELREDGQARESFERALRMDPNSSEVLNNYGWFLCVNNETQRGLDMLKRASADPLYQTPEKAFLSSGLCLKRAGRAAEAEAQLRTAVSIRPDLIGALVNLAELSHDRGANKDAEAYITRYMRLTQPNVDSLLLGVKIARATGNKPAEESYLQQMRRRFPEAPQTREAQAAKKP